MNTSIKARAAAVLLATGTLAGASVMAAPAASAYSVWVTGQTTICVGPDLWNARIERVDYSFWEEISYPWPKDYTRYVPYSLNQYRNPYCVQRTYA